MPHVPLFSSPEFSGKSARGKYGDAIEELDHNVGRLLDALKQQGIAEKTLVVYSSDNGPWDKGADGGTAYPFRGYKFSNWEGGMRVPAIFWWPGTIPANQVRDEPAIVLDLYRTIARLTGGGVPTDRVIDGEDIWPLVMGEPGAKHGPIYYDLGAIREGNWKLREGALYNLANDPHEDNNLAVANPAIVDDLRGKLQAFQNDVKQNSRPLGGAGSEAQPSGCTNPAAPNYDINAKVDDGSCGVL
ncbi:MAG: hypothetical protein RJA70_3421 [Pseudomonadota bacterium]|jgi:arylsulfatase A-like enzyme